MRIITRLNVGGPAQQACLLTSRLDEERFETVLLVGRTGDGEGNMLDLRPELADGLNGRMVEIPGLGRDPAPFSDLRALRMIRGQIERFRPDVVHTHMAKAGTLGRIAAAIDKVPVRIHTFHGTVFRGHFSRPLGRMISEWERVLAHTTNQILVVSDAVADDLVRRGLPADRIQVVPLGLDLGPFAAIPRLPFPPPRRVALIARLVPVKDVPFFVNAAEIVRASLPDLEAIVVGDGPLRRQLERTSPSWVRFLGNRADLPEILSEVGAVALSSRSEGSPVALIEALSAARPVAAVPVGGVVDILRDRPGAVVAR
jgi:glycosyltransferase involved in cell wall biosynthesis